jgi:putative ABC transport system permease protein
VLAIAVGVFAFASVLITGDMLITNIDAQYRAVNTSSITIYTRSDDDNLARWAQRQNEVADAQVRGIVSTRLISSEESYNMDLYVYEDYADLTINVVTPEQGKWPPGHREILLERTSAAHLGVSTGDEITIEQPDGTQHRLLLVGTVHDLNAVPAGLFPQLSGYVTPETISLLDPPSFFNRLEIVAQDEYGTSGELDKIAQELKERLQKTGVSVGDFYSVREADEHWGRETTQSFTLILTAIGIFSLVLSGFLVVNTMSALMTEQQRQIGMMKAIGGTGRQIIGMYLVLVTSYGVLALAVAIPVGLGLAYVFTTAVVNFLNLNMLTFSLPLSVVVLQIMAALIVPAVAAAIPIRGGMRISVREAISNHGIKVREHQGWLDRMTIRVQRLPRPVLLSLRNTFRRKGRLFLTLGTLTLAGTLFISVINVRTSLMTELDNLMETVFNYELQIYFDDSYPTAGVQHRVERMAGVVKTESQTRTAGQRVMPDGTEGADFGIVGISPNSEFVRPRMLSGRWLNESDRDTLVLSSSLAEEMPDVKVGMPLIVKIGEKEYIWKVSGIMLMAFDRVAYADFNYVSSIMGTSGMASSIFIRTVQEDRGSQVQMVQAVEQQLKEAGIGVAYSMTKDTIVSSNANQFDFLTSFLLSMAAMSALIGGLGLAGMMGLSVMERTREIGVLRSIGASNGAVGSIVITEALLIGIISWLVSLPVSIPISLAFNSMLGNLFIDKPLIFVYPLAGPIVWLLIVVVISAIASILPARRAIKMSVQETLAYE